MLQWILSWFGGGPLATITNALGKAYSDKLNATTEHEKIAANERILTLTVALADVANARSAASNLPWWLAWIAFLIGGTAGLHASGVFFGTFMQPLIVDTWLGDWLLHIPPLPNPYDDHQAAIIGFFFGFGAVVVGVNGLKRKS